jgi:hypothetical protein
VIVEKGVKLRGNWQGEHEWIVILRFPVLNFFDMFNETGHLKASTEVTALISLPLK